MTTDDNEIHIGFMESVLGRAKKVLFPEAEAVHVGVGTDAASPSSSSIANPNERRKARSRARLAASKSTLANIASDVTEGTGSGALKVRAGAVGAGKENKLTKNSGKRCNTSKLDSLAMAFSINADSDAKSDRVSGSEMRQSKGVSYAKDCRQVMRGNNIKKQARQPLKSLSANALSRDSGPNSNLSVVSLKSKSTSNSSDNDHPFTLGTATNNGKVRRRGRCNNISFETNESTKERSKRYTGPSSLMMLPSSTQKVQRPISSSDAMRRQKPVSRRTTNNNKCVGNRLPPSSNRPSLENIMSEDNVNDTTLASALDVVSIGEGQANCSTPHSIRHRNSGSITSPPSFLHRLSKLSDPNFFQDHSPLPDSNPKLRKRFDGKKTPDNKSGAQVVTSPLASEATMSFSPFASEEDGYDATINNSNVVDDQDFIGRTISATDIKSPIISAVVTSNDFPSISGQQEPDTNNDITEPGLVRLESAGAMETSSPHSTKRVGEMETNPTMSMIAPHCRNEDRDVESAEPISEDSNLSNEPPSNDQNAKSELKGKTTKRMPPTRRRVAKKDGDEITSVEVRKSSRNSKPTDRLTVTSWNNKKKPVRSSDTEPEDEVIVTGKEKRMVRSGKGGSVNKVSTKKEKPKARSSNKAKGDEVEDGADWESYQSYIQSLLKKNCKQGQS